MRKGIAFKYYASDSTEQENTKKKRKTYTNNPNNPRWNKDRIPRSTIAYPGSDTEPQNNFALDKPERTETDEDTEEETIKKQRRPYTKNPNNTRWHTVHITRLTIASPGSDTELLNNLALDKPERTETDVDTEKTKSKKQRRPYTKNRNNPRWHTGHVIRPRTFLPPTRTTNHAQTHPFQLKQTKKSYTIEDIRQVIDKHIKTITGAHQRI